MKASVVPFACLGLLFAVVADATCPELTHLFPTPHISLQQFTELRAAVLSRPGNSCRPFGPNQLECGSDSSRELWWFTDAGHPAHPAASRGQIMTERESSLTCLVRDGYFAGEESPFAAWMRTLRKYDDDTIASFRKR
jgi:hypothetical protein